AKALEEVQTQEAEVADQHAREQLAEHRRLSEALEQHPAEAPSHQDEHERRQHRSHLDVSRRHALPPWPVGSRRRESASRIGKIVLCYGVCGRESARDSGAAVVAAAVAAFGGGPAPRPCATSPPRKPVTRTSAATTKLITAASPCVRRLSRASSQTHSASAS